MKKKYTVAILGTGGRGYAYGSLIKERPDEFEVVALCDRKAKQLEKENPGFKTRLFTAIEGSHAGNFGIFPE